MKAVRIIHEEILQQMNNQERRIISYVAAKKGQTGHFPIRHRQNSKRLKAFQALIAKGIIRITGSDKQSVLFRLNPLYCEQKFHRFYTSTGWYINKRISTTTQTVSKFKAFVKRMLGIVSVKQKGQQLSGI